MFDAHFFSALQVFVEANEFIGMRLANFISMSVGMTDSRLHRTGMLFGVDPTINM